MKKALTVFLVFLLVFSLSGCAKTYTLRSNDVYAYGEKLNGNGIVDATLKLSSSEPKAGTSVELVYAGKTYKGTVSGGYVIWDREPYIFADATSMYTQIYGSGDRITLSFNAQVSGHWVESRQRYEAK